MSLTNGTTKTVLELDLVSYSDISRVLEENLDVHAVKLFQDQIQSFVDEGLRSLGLSREDVVFGTAGDNALLFFDDAATAHRFAEVVQRASADHNRRKSVESAKRWFRIGAATGTVLVLVSERRIVGTTVARAVRLEAAARRGQLVVDVPTFDALPENLKAHYSPEEVVCGKREEQYDARRCTFIEGLIEPDAPQCGVHSSPNSPSSNRIRTLLWVNDKPNQGELEVANLRARGIAVVRVASTSEAMRLLVRGDVSADAVVSDMGRYEEGEYRGHAGVLLTELIRKARFKMPVVVYGSPKYLGKNHAMVVEAGGTGAVATETSLLAILGLS